jgi:hypothetical protein
VNPSRRIKLCFDGAVAMSAGAGNRARFRFREGATHIRSRLFGPATNGTENASFSAIITPTAGSHTYKLQLTSEDAGNAVLKATSAEPVDFWIEDLGPV